MPLTPEEQQELAQLEALVGKMQGEMKPQAPSIQDLPKGPMEMLNDTPNTLGKMAGVMGATTGIAQAAQAILPGSDPNQIMQGAQSLIKNPGQVPQAFSRGIQAASPDFQPSPQEKGPMLAGQIAANGMSMMQPSIAGRAGKALAGATEAAADTAGVQAKNLRYLLENPTAMLTAPTKAGVKQAYKVAEGAEQVGRDLASKTPTELLAGAKTSAKKVIGDAAAIISDGDNAGSAYNARKLIRGRQAIDQELKAVKNAIERGTEEGKATAFLKDKFANFTELRKRINSVLDTIAPKFREADRMNAEQMKVDAFRTLNPAKLGLGAVTSAIGATRHAATPLGSMMSQTFDRVMQQKLKKRQAK